MTLLTDSALTAWAAYWEQGLDPTSPHPDALGYTAIVWLPGRRGFCGVKDGVFTVAIAGTQSVSDFITDVMCTRVLIRDARNTPCTIHKGFWSDVVEIRDAVVAAYRVAVIGKLITADYAVFLGHSLGGGVAMGLSRIWGLCPIKLVTFGCPRTGDKTFVAPALYVIESIRVWHDRDLIPTVPFGMGYEHCDQLLHLTVDGSKLRWWHRLWRRLTRDIPLLSDHPIHLYAAAVRAHETP